MLRTDDFDRRGVWVEEAMHRAANLQHLAANLERLLDSDRIDASNRPRTIRRANALASAYQSLDTVDASFPCSCAQGLKDITSGLVEIFGHTVGSLVLSLELQELPLAGQARRALLLAGSELVVNALCHAFVGRHTGVIQIAIDHDPVRRNGSLIVADDGVGPSGVTNGSGLGRTIVRELADVLDGEVVWRQSPVLGGTEVILNFPLPIAA
jgi:two-component system, sensor histidine kinase PdtaS